MVSKLIDGTFEGGIVVALTACLLRTSAIFPAETSAVVLIIQFFDRPKLSKLLSSTTSSTT